MPLLRFSFKGLSNLLCAERVLRNAAFAVGFLALVIGALATCAEAQQRTSSQDLSREALQQCPAIVSLDGHIVMEQWAHAGQCDKPIRTRVTDLHLGFTCHEKAPGDVSACRSFVPPTGTRKLDTSRFFRCVDIAVTDGEEGIVMTRLKDWVVPLRQCDWTRSLDVPFRDILFATREVCSGGLCIRANRLSAIGAIRLRDLIEQALREFGIGTSSVAQR